jgi:hypothetical protein
MYGLLADAIVVVHLLVVLFMVLGLVLVLVGWPLHWRWIRNPWFRITHLAIMGYIAFNALRGEYCFLTLWERDLRQAAGQTSEQEISFVGRLFREALYVEVPQEQLDRYYLVFGALVLIATVCVRPRRRARAGT